MGLIAALAFALVFMVVTVQGILEEDQARPGVEDDPVTTIDPDVP